MNKKLLPNRLVLIAIVFSTIGVITLLITGVSLFKAIITMIIAVVIVFGFIGLIAVLGKIVSKYEKWRIDKRYFPSSYIMLVVLWLVPTITICLLLPKLNPLLVALFQVAVVSVFNTILFLVFKSFELLEGYEEWRKNHF